MRRLLIELVAVGVGFSWGHGVLTYKGGRIPCRSKGFPSERWG